MPPTQLRIAVIGNGPMAVGCLRVLVEHPGCDTVGVVADPSFPGRDSLLDFCRSAGIPALEHSRVNAREVRGWLRATAPDLLLSIVNFSILKRPMRELAPLGVVNFHNSPLPRYRGGHACSWAILDGAAEHGVTWHRVIGRADAGDILAQASFPIATDETVVSLTRKCFVHGQRLLPGLLDELREGRPSSRPQNEAEAFGHRFAESPNDGWVDFRWTWEALDRHLRALCYYPLPSPFVYLAATCGGRRFHVIRSDRSPRAKTSERPGEVVEILDRSLRYAIGDAIADLVTVADEEGRFLSVADFVRSYGVEVGSRFDSVAEGQSEES